MATSVKTEVTTTKNEKDQKVVTTSTTYTFQFPIHRNEGSESKSRHFKRNVPPFVYPSKSSDNDKKIQDILNFTEEHMKDNLDSKNYCAAFALIVIHRCLNALAIDNRVAYGYRSMGNSDNHPHLWLVIQGHVVDFVKVRGVCDLSAKYLAENTPHCYIEEKYEDINLKMSDSEEERYMRQEKKLLEFFDHEPDRGLALCLNEESLTDYYFSIIRHMAEKYETTIIGIDPRVRYICWNCDKYPKTGITFLSDILSTEMETTENSTNKKGWRFPHCHDCMVANYCSPECQKKDWVSIHRYTCISRSLTSLQILGH